MFQGKADCICLLNYILRAEACKILVFTFVVEGTDFVTTYIAI